MQWNFVGPWLGALALSVADAPGAPLFAQPAAAVSDSAVWSARTFEVSGGILRAAAPFGNDASFGLTAQVSKRLAPRVRWALQAGTYWNAALTACDIACIGTTSDQVFVAPLIGSGFRNRSFEVRGFLGPRVMLTDGPSRLGAQLTADFSLGNRLGAIYVPVTWSWNRFDGRTLQQRSIGIGLQNR